MQKNESVKSAEKDSRVRQRRDWLLHRDRRHAQALQAKDMSAET